MHIVIAPDSFKGTLSAAQAGAAMATGVRRALPQARLTIVPLADGGEGTLDVMVDAAAGTGYEVPIRGPLSQSRRARVGLLNRGSGGCGGNDGDGGGDGNVRGATAIVEMAEAAGLLLSPPQDRDVMRATTFGVGQLIRAAMDAGARHVFVGAGGSATNDGGAGCAQALGVRFYDAAGYRLSDGIGGGALDEIARIDLENVTSALKTTSIVVLADVFNPLVGPCGAARTYATQKGASANQVERLDANLCHFASLIQRDTGCRVATTPGAGAAGGLAAGLIAFAGAELRSGAEEVIEHVGLEKTCATADGLLTGEGCFDSQSRHGKVVSAVAALGERLMLPVFVLAGAIHGTSLPLQDGCRAVEAVGDSVPANSEAAARDLAARASALAPRWFSDGLR